MADLQWKNRMQTYPDSSDSAPDPGPHSDVAAGLLEGYSGEDVFLFYGRRMFTCGV